MNNRNSKTHSNSDLPDWIDHRWLTRFRRRLIRWYDQHHRLLPWRETDNPYAIWVSEIMLQQTQVATVIPYYERFLRRFDSVKALADADEVEVLRHWEGLGYYRRARQMHAAARRVVNEHQGEFPTSLDEVLALPGIGRYTAGAICSFAYDQPAPIVEANTQRLYARLLRLSEPLVAKDSQAMLWSFAEEILPTQSGRTINQAVMELGSLVCQPKPHCDVCPLQDLCPTFAGGLQAVIPAPKKKTNYEARHEVALIIQNSKSQYLVRQCRPDEWWAGLWDFPRFEVMEPIDDDAIFDEIADQAKLKFGLACRVESFLFSVKHSVTKYRITLKCFSARLARTKNGSKKSIGDKHFDPATHWVSSEELAAMPLSASGRRVTKRLA